MKYDLIGDIHGYSDELEKLLGELGYRTNENGVYVPGEENRKAIFIGDFIDRGPGQFRVIEVVRGMVDAGHAEAIMGNHEFNAGMYHTHVDIDGVLTPLRSRNAHNDHQHRAFLDAMDDDVPQGRQNVAWIKDLPLFLEKDGLRAVHALWDQEAIDLLKSSGVLDEKNRIKHDKWVALADYKAPLGRAAERLTKGAEVELPAGKFFHDTDGIERRWARLKWWANLDDPTLTLDKVVLDVKPGAIPADPIPEDVRAIMRTAQATKDMVFFGHYWQQGKFPDWESSNAICIDQSVAKDGHLAAATVTVEDGKIQDIETSSVKTVSKPYTPQVVMRRAGH